jgi:hypothetical protein
MAVALDRRASVYLNLNLNLNMNCASGASVEIHGLEVVASSPSAESSFL